jgi:predicted secreted protein
MGKVRGEDVVIKFDIAHNYPILGCARTITFDLQQDMIETSVKGTGRFRTYVPGAMSWSGTIEGLTFINQNYSENYGLSQFYDDLINKVQVTIIWYQLDEFGTTFLQKIGYGYIESINETSSFDNMATFTANFKGSGPITITTGII